MSPDVFVYITEFASVMKSEKLIVPEEVSPVSPDATPAPVTFHVSESITTFSPSSPRFTNPFASSS